MDCLLWLARVWVDEKGLRHTLFYDCVTEESIEECHPIEDDLESQHQPGNQRTSYSEKYPGMQSNFFG